ncbi:gag-pol polyprotein [Tanacetum coccineum]
MSLPSKTTADSESDIQEMAEYSQKWHNGTSRTRSIKTFDGLAAIQAQLKNLGREIKKVNKKVYAAQVGCKQCKGPHYTKHCLLKEEGLGELAHTKLTVKLADRTVKYLKGIAENVLVGIGKFVFLIDFIILDMPEDIKVPLILGRPFLSTAHAKIDVFKRKITLRVGEEKIIFKSIKPASSLIKRVYMLSLRERMELDLEARLMGETLVLNRSLDPFFEDYIELNDLNVPLELRRDQVDDLMPTIEEGEVIKEFRARNDARMVSKIFGYPSDCDHDKKIRIDCAHNMKFSCMLVLEDMDAYRDEGMGDAIFHKPFLREVGINARRFKGIITIYNGSHIFDLTEKKSTMLVENLRSGNFEVLES